MQQEADRARCFTRRALFVGGVQVAFFGALAARLYHLQVERSADFALLAEDNRANQRLLVPPRGGSSIGSAVRWPATFRPIACW
jgi:penicillin-binding protein 2